MHRKQKGFENEKDILRVAHHLRVIKIYGIKNNYCGKENTAGHRLESRNRKLTVSLDVKAIFGILSGNSDPKSERNRHHGHRQ